MISINKRSHWITVLSLVIIAIFSIGLLNEVSAVSYPSINSDKNMYRVYNYRSGDCNLSANTYMIKRKAILLKMSNYADVKNDTDANQLKGGKNSVRKVACYNGSSPYNYNDVYNKYSYKLGNKTFKIESGKLSGSTAAKEKKIKSLLKNHPEGIVVWGPNCSSYGPHAILAAYVTKNGNIKYVDSAHNTWSNSKKWKGYNSRMDNGLETMNKTIVNGLGGLTKYWYIKSVK